MQSALDRFHIDNFEKPNSRCTPHAQILIVASGMFLVYWAPMSPSRQEPGQFQSIFPTPSSIYSADEPRPGEP